MAAALKYYSLSSNWDDLHLPADYPAGNLFASAKERQLLHNASWYWMAYEPGYVAFDIADDACCGWSTWWPTVMETDVGVPTGVPYLADQGTLTGGWAWTLWARDYSKATVYYRGNNAWRDGNGASIGYAAATQASMTLPVGADQILRSDGSWTTAPSTVTHYDSFGFVVRAIP